MLSKLVNVLIGDKQKKNIKALQPYVVEINEHMADLAELSEEELCALTDTFRRRLIRGETLDELMCEAFAVVKEACRRLLGTSWKITGHDSEWNMVPFDVQLMGAVVLYQGRIAEMATGEGKTLVAVMPLYLNALEPSEEWLNKARERWGEDVDSYEFQPIDGVPVGKGAHLVTVNDYLARRDAQWMGPVFEYLGLTVGGIQGGMTPEERKQQYNCDVTYGTNNEFGFDYLRDNMTSRLEHQVHRGYNYAIIDEVDSVLIDEARTPLIISGPVPRSRHRYKEYRDDVRRLVGKQTVLINNLVSKADQLWDSGDHHAAATMYLKAKRGAPKHKKLAKALRDPDRLQAVQRVEAERLRDKNLHELDEDLLFSIDEREKSVALSDQGREVLSPSDPDFFLLRDIGDVMAEIEAKEVGEEEKHRLRQKAYEKHSRKAEALHNIDQLLKAFQLFEKDVEYVVKDGRVMIVDQFTGRLMPGRRFSDGLHEALEAKEGVEIRSETQTLATITIQNYFRMYDKLAGMTGTAVTEEAEFESIYDLDVVVVPTNVPVVRTDHDDRVYKTKREKYNAIIDEISRLHSRGQPILVGTVSVDVSEILSRMLKARKIPHSVLNAKHHEREAEIVARAGQPGAVTIATNMAGRGTDIRLSQEVKKFVENGETVPGGLFVIGTERHEARRIDRQLRGRGGRQGDPGASRFHLSLEDDLFRLFASEKMIDFLKKSGGTEGETIEHPMLTKAIERAQKRVEEYNFGIRKNLLEYDDVANRQREVIYERRRQSLTGEGLREEVREMIQAMAEHVLNPVIPDDTEPEEWNLERAGLILGDLSGRPPYDLSGLGEGTHEPELARQEAAGMVLDYYDQKVEQLGEELMSELEKWAVLSSIDTGWREHLYSIDHLKSGIGLRAYGQRDPLVEFKKEAFALFENLLDDIDKLAVRKVLSLWPKREGLPQKEAAPKGKAYQPGVRSLSEVGQKAGGGGGQRRAPAKKQKTVTRKTPKVGRNDPCPCGSGRKYKKCCGR
ncbi:preprotein translocase subunit SecA [Candidatus Fermentibacteria bacterium]|nr:preprotein translocase subunit SecA [Candidatus Fermentibacteria bacterium]